MAAYDSGNFKPRRDMTHLWWGLGGVVLGIGIAAAGPRVWNRIRPAPQKPGVAVVAKPTPKPVETLQISADLTQRGLVLTAPVPVRLIKNSQAKLAKQQDRAVFTGFRSWGGTTRLLTSGQGNLVLKSATGTTTNWKQGDYKEMMQKKPLTAQVATGQSYTLFFQRKGRSMVDLGTFGVGGKAPPAQAAAKAKVPPAAKKVPEPADDMPEQTADDMPQDAPEDIPLDATEETPAPID